MDTFRFLKYWKTHGVFPVNACSTPRMTITATIPAAVSHHHYSSSMDISPDEDHRTNHGETIDFTGEDDENDGENERDEFLKFTEPIDLYFKANEESRSSAVKSAIRLKALMLKLKKSKGDGAEKMEFDDPVLTTASQTQRKLTTAELRVKEVTKSEKLAQTPDSLRLVRTPSYHHNKEEAAKFEKLAWTPSLLRLARTPSYHQNKEDVIMFEKLIQTPGSFRLVRTPSYHQTKEEAAKFEKLAWTPSLLRLARTPGYQNKEEVTKLEKLTQTPSSLRLVRTPSYHQNKEEATKFEKPAWTPRLLRLARISGHQKKEEVTKSEKHISKESAGPNQTRFSSDLVQKYIEKVKPMYIGVSKRYNERKVRLARVKSPREMSSGQSPPSKMRLAAQLRVKSPREMKSGQSLPSKVRLATQLRVKSPRETRSGQSPPSKSYTTKSKAEKRRSRQHEMTEVPPLPVVSKKWKDGNLSARLRLGRKNAGKGWSASSGLTQEKKRDDSMLEKEDGIQSAILHCKKSFNASRDSASLNLSENCSEEHEETGTGDGHEVGIRL